MTLKISVLIVCRNRKDLLATALDSVINQTLPAENYEIVIIDDGSDDDSIEKLASQNRKKFANLRYLRQKPSGLAAGRNFGAKNAKAGIIAFTDSDCIAQKDWLEELLKKFGSAEFIGVEGKIITDKPRRLFTSAPENPNGGRFIGANSAYLKSIIKKAGYYDIRFGCWRDDSEFALRAMRHGKIGFAEKAVVYHPLRKDKPLSMFRYLFYLRNEWISMFRHKEKFFQYHGMEITRNLLKSLKAYAFFSAFLYGIIFNNPLVALAAVLGKPAVDFSLLRISAFKEKIRVEPTSRGISDFLLYSFLSWIWELEYPLFFLCALPIAVISGFFPARNGMHREKP